MAVSSTSKKNNLKVSIILKKPNKQQPRRAKGLKAAHICQTKRRGGTTNDPTGNTSCPGFWNASGSMGAAIDTSAANPSLGALRCYPNISLSLLRSQFELHTPWAEMIMNFKAGMSTGCWQYRQNKFSQRESPTLACNWNVLFCPKHQRSLKTCHGNCKQHEHHQSSNPSRQSKAEQPMGFVFFFNPNTMTHQDTDREP